jgi:hypothetical protein
VILRYRPSFLSWNSFQTLLIERRVDSARPIALTSRFIGFAQKKECRNWLTLRGAYVYSSTTSTKVPFTVRTMKKPLFNETLSDGVLTVLSVSPIGEDHSTIKSLIGHSRWMLHEAHNTSVVTALLRRHPISVVLCERDLPWTDVLQYVQEMRHPASLIVTSRLADDHLWMDVLARGGWDVLAKPFNRNELFRSVRAAWQHWYNQCQQVASPMRITMSAAS